jgi:sortase A
VRRKIGWLLIAVGLLLILTPLLGKGYGYYSQFLMRQELERDERAAGPAAPVLETPPCIRPPFLLTIPAISLEAVVVEGTESKALSKAPGLDARGVYPGMPGNVIIAAHRNIFGAWFRDLDELQHGDEIYISSGATKITYIVESVQTVPDDDLSVLKPSASSSLTLITCDLPVSSGRRIVVRAFPAET